MMKKTIPALWGYAPYWASMVLRDKTRIVVRSMIDYGITFSRRGKMRTIELSPLNKVSPLKDSDIPLIVVVRNERKLVRSFLEHYRSIGVNRFIVVDDQSSDGTRELFNDQLDAMVFTSNTRYGPARRGQLWRQKLAEKFGLNRWYVNVDIDEYLIYDGMERHPLPELIRKLGSMGAKRSLAPMIDLYPDSLSAGLLNDGRNPWDVANNFDAKDYWAWKSRMCVEVNGGVLFRCFRDKGVRTKFPLIFWDRFTFPVRTVHSPLPYWRNYDPPSVAVLHFKLFSDCKKKMFEAVQDGQRYRNAEFSRLIYERLSDGEPLELKYEGSARYEGPRDLVDKGFISQLVWD